MTAPEVIETANFHVADYVIFGLTIAVSAGVGVYFGVTGGRQKTTTEYLVGNRRMKIAPVALSLVVSFESSILLLGFPAEMYGHGTQFWMCFIGQSLALLFAARVCVPLIHPLRVTSSYEYLELRYRSRRVRLIGSALGILYQTFYMGIVLFGPAIALEAVTGFPVWSSVILVAAASVFYTSLGGIKAVIWTDAIQCVIMTGGMLAITIMGCLYVGGFGEMWQLNVDGGRVKFLDFDPNPLVRHTFWTLVVGTTMRSIELGFNQTTVQRVVSMETPTKAQIVVLLAIPGFVGFGTLACLEGMMTYAYFRYTDCDPYGAKLISNTNQVAPYMVVEMFRNLPGLPGLFLASLFSASLSTLSSSLSSISAIIWTDFLRPHMPNASERKGTIFAKAAVVVFGGIAIGISFLIMLIGGPLQQIAIGIMGAVSGPLSGMFIAGCFCTITNSVGAITGGVVSLAISLWLTLGSSFSPYTVRTPYLPPAGINNCFVNGTFNSTLSSLILSNITTPLPEPATSWETTFLTTFYSISYLYVAPIGVVTCALVSVLVSSLTGGCRTAEYVDPKYIAPVWDNLCCCLPESFRRKLRYKGHAIQRD